MTSVTGVLDLQKIALLFVSISSHLVKHLNRCPTHHGHVWVQVFIALNQI